MISASTFPREALKRAMDALAAQNIFIGTSSWKYPGWRGQLYDEQRYIYRGKFAESRFERDCLEEYAKVFHTVCVDAGYYRFPSPQFIDGLVKQTPPGFKFGFKVTDEITARTFTKLPRHGDRAGKRNEHFLDAELFQKAFLSSCEPHRDRIGVLIFEFSHFHPRDFERGRDFVDMLDRFLGELPQGWQYGIEIRNRNLLQAEYFDMLRKHNVTHVFNNWSNMPSVAEQIKIDGAFTSHEFTASRLLLKPGRSYEDAVKLFSPYEETREVADDARAAAAELIRMRMEAAQSRQTKGSFVFVNNRLEGNALFTILGILSRLGFDLGTGRVA
jgi:uncharacterized protein YecE (DUF72 family)